jgi:hypothetical protein
VSPPQAHSAFAGAGSTLATRRSQAGSKKIVVTLRALSMIAPDATRIERGETTTT